MKKFFLLITAALMSAGVIAQGDFGNNGNLSEYQSQKDIDYVGDSHIGHKLDIYYPNDDETTHPVLIHIYASAWASNNMKGYADLTTVGAAALQAGYVFVTPNHRSSSDALFPAQIQDIKAVVRYLRGNAENLGLDTSFIAVSGFSSGGHLAALTGGTRHLTEYTLGTNTIDLKGDLGNHNDQSSSVDAVCSWSGFLETCDMVGCTIPSDITPFIEKLTGFVYESNPYAWALASANLYVNAKNAPVILFHGSADAVYPQCVSENYYSNLVDAGVDCEYYPHDGTHSVNADYTDEMIAFLNRIKAAKAEKTAVDQPAADTKACKRVVNGHLLIHRAGKTFNATGAEIK